MAGGWESCWYKCLKQTDIFGPILFFEILAYFTGSNEATNVNLKGATVLNIVIRPTSASFFWHQMLSVALTLLTLSRLGFIDVKELGGCVCVCVGGGGGGKRVKVPLP